MAKDETKSKKQNPARFTLAPLYLAAGLFVCYIVLTKMIPAMTGIVDERAKAQPADLSGWHGLTLELSHWASSHKSFCLTTVTILAIGGFVLTFLLKSARYVIWAFALLVFFLDVALAGGGYWNMLSGLLKEANNLNR